MQDFKFEPVQMPAVGEAELLAGTRGRLAPVQQFAGLRRQHATA